jgi:hypothetical protein
MVEEPYRLVCDLIKYQRNADCIEQLIIDSASGLFRVDFVGRGELSERQV